MRIFYDEDGKRISRKAIRKRMDSEMNKVGSKSDTRVRKQTLNNMSEEDYVKLNTRLAYKDFKKKKG